MVLIDIIISSPWDFFRKFTVSGRGKQITILDLQITLLIGLKRYEQVPLALRRQTIKAMLLEPVFAKSNDVALLANVVVLSWGLTKREITAPYRVLYLFLSTLVFRVFHSTSTVASLFNFPSELLYTDVKSYRNFGQFSFASRANTRSVIL